MQLWVCVRIQNVDVSDRREKCENGLRGKIGVSLLNGLAFEVSFLQSDTQMWDIFADKYFNFDEFSLENSVVDGQTVIPNQFDECLWICKAFSYLLANLLRNGFIFILFCCFLLVIAFMYKQCVLFVLRRDKALLRA